jgi:hypothetical protein
MYFLYTYEYEAMKPVEVILRKEEGKKENNGGNEPTWDTLYAYTEMSQ